MLRARGDHGPGGVTGRAERDAPGGPIPNQIDKHFEGVDEGSSNDKAPQRHVIPQP